MSPSQYSPESLNFVLEPLGNCLGCLGGSTIGWSTPPLCKLRTHAMELVWQKVPSLQRVKAAHTAALQQRTRHLQYTRGNSQAGKGHRIKKVYWCSAPVWEVLLENGWCGAKIRPRRGAIW